MHNLIEWTKGWALYENPAGSGIITLTPYASWALFINAFVESSFFPVPPDILLIGMCIASPKDALWFALLCLIGSTLGGMFGYLIGLKGGKPILTRLIKEEKIKNIHAYFEKYEEWAIGIAGFTPIPYKIFAIAAGVFYINFWKFVFVTIISRGARFFLVAGSLMLFGKHVKIIIENHFDKLTVVIAVMVVIGFLAMNYIKIPHKHEKEPDIEDEGAPKLEKQ